MATAAGSKRLGGRSARPEARLYGRGGGAPPPRPRLRAGALPPWRAGAPPRACWRAPRGALLALSKPPGLPVLGRSGELSLVLLLPVLRRRLGLPAELHVVKAPARECSGLVLLSGCHRATEQLQRFFADARRRGQYPATYHAVTVGVPAEAEGEIRAGLRWQQQGDTTVVVPVPAPGRRSLARKEVKSTLTHYRVLGTAGGCALLQLQPRTAFPEQLPVHLTLLLCPALGDHKHSSRVGRVLGVPFLLPPEAAPTRTQMLDEELLCRLGISPRQLHRLPLHLHLQQLVLPQGPLCAPPPPPFLRTLRRLGLPGHPEPPATRSPLPPH
ncbi:mitochondrial mRNA pseudouridine synthase RPUSD3 isoform X4 [Aquila chrysaetos chrysaetos]|uniref:mitochondrial mRNA pseudouridine synthase RPUSD3 isoform X4 n=1 Tax=Aquila chrysaetos chrysaetos TaxID=223781 RepID=UPI001176D5FA|nr:mitochondrial mRNA pseudouridine synthase RPUSD3 isoform X4 [Aquila chrysaetos chrysaetos]